jgi:metallo-beta-lactamase family protein
VKWFDSMAHARPRVILTHGEDKPRDALRRIIADRHQLSAECPGLNEAIEI